MKCKNWIVCAMALSMSFTAVAISDSKTLVFQRLREINTALIKGELTEAQAETVQEYLRSQGISETKIAFEAKEGHKAKIGALVSVIGIPVAWIIALGISGKKSSFSVFSIVPLAIMLSVPWVGVPLTLAAFAAIGAAFGGGATGIKAALRDTQTKQSATHLVVELVSDSQLRINGQLFAVVTE